MLGHGLSDGDCSLCLWVAVGVGEENSGGYTWKNETDFHPSA